MTRTTRTTLTTVAALLAALVALPARADHDDGWRHTMPPVAYPAPAYAAPPHAPAPAPAVPAVTAPYRRASWGAGWRAHELRNEYRELELARDRFYATWDGRPWTRARFESWYGSRRAALDARWAALGRWNR